MTLAAPAAEPLTAGPAATSLSDVAEPDVSGLIDTLTNRVGAERLYRLAAVESDVPERSVRKVAPLSGPTQGRWPKHWPRPARLLSRPEPIETIALLPDNPPTHFTWRGVRRRVRRADGPERIYGEWRRRDAEMFAVRDYFQVEDDAGQRFWLSAPATARTRRRDRKPGFCMACSDEICRAAMRLAFLLPARREFLRGAVRPGGDDRHRSAGNHRPQQPGRHRPRARGGKGHKNPADRRLPPGPDRRQCGAGLSNRPPSLC